MNTAPLSYRPCVGIMAVNRAGFVWVGRRVIGRAGKESGGSFDRWWQMPQGASTPVRTRKPPRYASFARKPACARSPSSAARTTG